MNSFSSKVENFRPSTLFKRNSSTGVFLCTLRSFSIHLFFPEYSGQLLLSAEEFSLRTNYYSSESILLEEQLIDRSHCLIFSYPLWVCLNIQNLDLCLSFVVFYNGNQRLTITNERHMRTNTTEISSIYWNVLLWIFLNESVYTKKENTTRTIRHLLFDFILSRINRQIFRLKYSILVLEQDVSIFT